VIAITVEEGEQLIEHGFTSAPTQYRLYGKGNRRVGKVKGRERKGKGREMTGGLCLLVLSVLVTGLMADVT